MVAGYSLAVLAAVKGLNRASEAASECFLTFTA